MPGDDAGIFRCSFCNRTQRDVKTIISGGGANICDGCVHSCFEMLTEDPSSTRCRLCGAEADIVESLSAGDHVICPACVETLRPFFAAGG